MEKKPWKTFYFLQMNLFGSCYIENIWEDLSSSKPGNSPVLPQITMHNTG